MDERTERKGIVITDNLLKLKEHFQFSNFSHEVEARWRLVETAWSLKISPYLLEVRHDLGDNILFTETDLSRRINITSSRNSLNGYQKGKCFYCKKDIRIEKSDDGDFVENVKDMFQGAEKEGVAG